MNLVTGATGIVGSHVLLELLQRGQQVVACKQPNSNMAAVEQLFAYYTPDHKTLFEKIKWVEVDIRDLFSVEAALDGITAVYHCAGLVSFSKKDRQRLQHINETGTANVANACLNKGVPLCHVSSIATINNLDYILPLHEGVFWKTSGRESDYAISKYNGEREVWRAMEEGLDAVIVNPGLVLSPGFWQQSSARLFDACYNGNRFYTSGTAAYVAATDVAKIMVELMQKRLYGNRYIVIEGNYKFHDLLNEVHGQLKRPLPAIKVSRPVLRLAALGSSIGAFFTSRPPKITGAMANAAFNQQLFSNSKILETLEFKFEPAYSAIARICRQYLAQKPKGRAGN